MLNAFLIVVLAIGCSSSKYTSGEEPASDFEEVMFHEPQQVTAGNESNFAPDLSANGKFVVYASDRSGNKDLWEKSVQGGFSRPLTFHTADDFAPVISPDGTRIAFVSRREDAAGDIHFLELGTSLSFAGKAREKKVRTVSIAATEEMNPAWFPDSERIVFGSRRAGDKIGILMMTSLDEPDKIKILGDFRGEQPTVSPDGRWIGYVRDGAIYAYELDRDRSVQVTPGGLLQDGHPRFSDDGKFIVFVRYADDTNRDGKLNGEDNPTVWRVPFDPAKGSVKDDRYGAEPLTSARYASFSPQVRGPYLYMALQNSDGLDIFRLPSQGQISRNIQFQQAVEFSAESTDFNDSILALRKAQFVAMQSGDVEQCAEAALTELEWMIRGGRSAEAQWSERKISTNFKNIAWATNTARIMMVELRLMPVLYPYFQHELTGTQQRHLTELLKAVDEIIAGAQSSDQRTQRVLSMAMLTRAKIFGSMRRFFEARDILAEVDMKFPSIRDVRARTQHYRALLTPAISGKAAGVPEYIRIAREFADDRVTLRRAAEDMIQALDSVGADVERVQPMVDFRSRAKGLPVMAARAHLRIAEIFEQSGKAPVAANEYRQIVTLYPESPGIQIDAVERYTRLEERSGHYDRPEEVLLGLAKNFEASPRYARQVKSLLIDFYLRRGEYFLRNKDFERSLAEYERVIVHAPESVGGHRGRIDVLFSLGRLDEATDYYEKMAADSPDSAASQYFLGYILSYQIDREKSLRGKLGAIDDAIALVEAARELDATIMQIHQTLGWLYLQKGFWLDKYYRSGSVVAGMRKRLGLVRDFVGTPEANWLELAIDSFQTAYFLTKEGTIDRANLSRNLAYTYFELKNFQKSLAYYMQRIRLLEQIPMRDVRAEAILFRNAGRAAFYIDELELAESLQRRALNSWEKTGLEGEIAYSLDALALTIRERGNCQDAARLYERLYRQQQRSGEVLNQVATLSSLGYCAFTAGESSKAIGYFQDAETLLTAIQTGGNEDKSDSGAIKVDLGGQGSAAKGFDLFGRQMLIVTFKGKIYEGLGRYDLAAAEYRRKLDLLLSQREKLIDDGKGKGVLAEEIAILHNNLGHMALAAGMHQDAKSHFKSAQTFAANLRADDQNFPRPEELINITADARVTLRMVALGNLATKDVQASVAELNAITDQIRKVAEEGSKPHIKSAAQLYALASTLKSVAVPAGTQDIAASLANSISFTEKAELNPKAAEGLMLAYQAVADGVEADAGIGPRFTEIMTAATAKPELEWRLMAGRGEFSKAFEALDRYIYGGGQLISPVDRLMARRVFDGHLAEELKKNDTAATYLLLRRYALLRMTDLIQRIFPEKVSQDGVSKIVVPDRLREIVAIKENAQVAAALGEDSILIAHKYDNEKILLALTKSSGTETEIVSVKASGGNDEVMRALGKSRLIASAGTKRLYVVPTAELFGIAWEEIKLDNVRLRDKTQLVFLPSVDVLPVAYKYRGILKENMGYFGEASAAVRASAASAGYLVNEVLRGTEPEIPLRKALLKQGVMRFPGLLELNYIEPWTGVVLYSEQARDFRKDILLKDLAGILLTETSLLAFEKVDHQRFDLTTGLEGHDGWVFLNIAALAARVPTVLLSMDQVSWPGTGQSGNEIPGKVAVTQGGSRGGSEGLARFYESFRQKSAAEALQASSLNARLLGYAGILSENETEFAEDQLEDVQDEGDDAFEEKEYQEAARLFQRAYAYKKKLQHKDVEKVLGDIVNSHYLAVDYQEALVYKLMVAELYQPEKNKDADILDYGEQTMEAAVLAVRAKKHEVAAQLMEKAEKIFAEEEDDALLGKVWHYRGIDAENQNKYTETIAAYEKSREFYLKSKPDQAALRLVDIGTIYRNRLSDYYKALDYYNDGAAELKKLNIRDAYLAVMIDLVNTHMSIGQLSDAISTLEREVIPPLKADEKSKMLLVRATQILANGYFRSGRYQTARELNEATLREIENLPLSVTRVDRQLDALGLRAMILAKTGRYNEAFEEFRSAITMAAKYKLRDQMALHYANYGFWAREVGNIPQSIEFMEIAKRIDEELKSRSYIAFDNRNLGISIIETGDYARARDLLQDSLKVSEELNLAYNRAYCHFGLGDLAVREKNHSEALDHYTKALDFSTKGQMTDFVWRAHAGVAFTQVALNRQAEGEKAYLEAVKVIESLPPGLKHERSRYGFHSDIGVQEVYQYLVLQLMKAGRIEAAWEYAERARARAFLDTIALQPVVLSVPGSNEALDGFRGAKARVDSLAVAVSRAGQKSRKRLENEFKEAKSELEQAAARMKDFGRDLSSFAGVNPVTLKEVGSAIGNDTALLSYMVTQDGLAVWVYRQGQLTGKLVPVAGDRIQKVITDYRLLMQNFSLTDYLGDEIAGLVLRPVEDAVKGADRLVVIPHGALHYLPFASLPTGGDGFLIDEFPLSYVDSASTLVSLSQGKGGVRLNSDSKVVALARTTGRAQGSLPFTAREAEVIGRYMRDTEVLVDSDATEATVLKGAADATILHIAAHGEFQPSDPLQSFVQLEPSGGADGRFTVQDAFGIKSRAELITLSSCESGMGKISTGDEMTGQTRAWMFSGARTVVSTLWRIDDVASAVGMKRFYRYLAEGHDRAEALRRSQKIVRRYFKHPAYWSAYKVNGAYN